MGPKGGHGHMALQVRRSEEGLTSGVWPGFPNCNVVNFLSHDNIFCILLGRFLEIFSSKEPLISSEIAFENSEATVVDPRFGQGGAKNFSQDFADEAK